MSELNYKYHFKSLMNSFRDDGFYRTFTPIIRNMDSFPFSKIDHGIVKKYNDNNSESLQIWCTNDYLNMSHNPDVVNEMIKVIRKVGTGSGGTRNISGTTPYHQNLEKIIADFHNKEAGLIFNSAYLANQTVIWTICKSLKDICVFSDSLNHASLIQGIKNSGSECKIFEHNDLSNLEKLLKNEPYDRPKLLVFESLYSMDGTIAPVNEYVELAKKYNALTYLDEVHAVGLYGKNGQGLAEHFNASDDIDIINGTLAKSFGQIGGYIVSDKYLTDYIKSFAPGFIFTTSMMPSVAAAASKSIQIVKKADDKRKYIMEHAQYLKKLLTEKNIPFLNNNSHIIPVMAYKSSKAKQYSKILRDFHNIYVQPIFYPTVAKNKARLRITVTPKHTKKDIEILVEALSKTILSEKIDIPKLSKNSDKVLVA